MYLKTEATCRKYTKLLTLVMIHLGNVVYGLFLINSFYCIYRGNLDTSTWMVPFNIDVPFDTSSVFGWYMFYIVQGFVAYTYSLNQPAIITFFMSCCLYIEALCEHFRNAISATEIDSLRAKQNFITAAKLHMKTTE